MIYHSILTDKRSIINPVQPLPSWNLTQEELNALIKDSGLSIGMFITSTKSQVTFLTQIEYIIGIEHNAAQVHYRYQNRDPMWLHVMSIPSVDMSSTDPWIRCDCETGYRQITVPEYEKLILPVNDFIQNRIKLGEEKYARDFSNKS